MRLWCAVVTFVTILTIGAVAQTELKVGVNLSTTGPVAALGIPEKNSILMAPSSIGGLKVRYIILDDGSDTTTAVQNVKRLITEDNVDLIIGPSSTPTALAVIDTVAEAKVPTIAMGSVSAITSPVDAKRRWVFKPIANDEIYVGAMISHMVKHGVRTAAMLAVNDSYGEGWIEQTKRLTAANGIKLLSIERFERSDNSTTPQAIRLIRLNPDAIIIAAMGTPAFTPHHSLKERGYKGAIYNSGGNNLEFLRVGGKTVEGSYVVGNPLLVAEQLPEGYPTKTTAIEFVKLYESKYGARPPFFAANAWDAIKLAEEAVPRVLKTGAKPGTLEFREGMRAALEQVRGMVGAGAVFNMSPTDHVGINQIGVAVMKIENGTWKLEQAAAF